MGMSRELFKNKISSLSLGQRMKIKLVEVILDEYNLLILDEPTNHLDLQNKLELERALIDYPGSILIATHDRYLLKKLTNNLLVFENNEIKKINKSYSEYMSNEMTTEEKKRYLENKMSEEGITEEEMNHLLEEYSNLY